MDPNDTGAPLGTGARTSEVHSEISVSASQRGAGGGSGGGSMADQARGKMDDVKQQAKGKVDDIQQQAQGKVNEVRDRATEMADQARSKADQALDQARSKLEQTGVPERIEENPLAALGIAFGIGFLLAGSGDDGHKGRGTLNKATDQIKGAIMGGVTAALAQEAKSMIGMQSGQGGGLGSMLSNLMGNQQGGSSGQGSSTRQGATGGTSRTAAGAYPY